MNSFSIFFPEGVRHITDLNGIDHILFLAALCLRYIFGSRKRLLLIITAFTIGHSVTLALSTLNVFSFPVAITEFLIAITIFITAAANLFVKEQRSAKENDRALYGLTLVFGLIHGMGFSTLLKSMLGKNANVVAELLFFNLGIEVGQIIIVAALMLAVFALTRVFKIKQYGLILVASGALLALSLELVVDRFPF